MIKKTLVFLSLIVLILGLTCAAFAQTDTKTYTISINQYVEHPSLNESVRGFKDQIAESGLTVNYNEHNAQANMPTVTQIVNQIIDEKPDLILAVATPSAQITSQKVKDIPILFTAVTDPITAGLVASFENPGGNMTGTTDKNPVTEQLTLIKEVQPDLTKLGVIYNAGEQNSVVQVELVKEVIGSLGIELIEATVPNTAGVNIAANSLIGKVDAIYLPTDNAVIASLEAVLKVALDHKIPLYPAEDDSVRKGGVAVLSISYYELGRQTGRMAVKILRDGEKPTNIPVENQTNYNLIVNTKFAQSIGLTIPDTVLNRASEKIEK
jgi:putative ABC transport system substrate-binding protein